MRKIVLMLSLAIGAFVAVPAQAAGFLQDIFERLDRRPPPIVYRYAPPQPQLRFYQVEQPRMMRRAQAVRSPLREARPHIRRKQVEARQIPIRNLGPRTAARTAPRVKVAALTPESVKAVLPPCCRPDAKTTVGIGGDRTLRVGDALMTSKGLRVFRGGAFVDYRKADLHQDAKHRLGALEQGAGAEGRMTAAASKLAVTRHVTAETAAQRTSVDRAGRVIRVVGP